MSCLWTLTLAGLPEFASFEEGWAEGQHRTHTEPESAFSLYRGKRRVARFGHHRLAENDATVLLDAMVGLS